MFFIDRKGWFKEVQNSFVAFLENHDKNDKSTQTPAKFLKELHA